WVNYLTSRAKDGILEIKKYGDWCPPSHVVSLDTPREVTDTWYYHRSLTLLSKMAGLLNKEEEQKSYADLANKAAEAFKSRFLNTIKSQTVDALAIISGMSTDENAKHLIRDVEVEHDKHISTGIIGTRYVFDALTQLGRVDLAYAAVTQTSYPGYGYMIREGATTLWERWELLGGRAMNSHNHIMFGSVDSWFYRDLAGISIDEAQPAFVHVIFHPRMVGLKWAEASVNTIRGKVYIAWQLADSLKVNVIVPTGSTASLHLPTGKLKCDGTEIDKEMPTGIINVRADEKETVVDFSSGSYEFELIPAGQR
ncbi:MAG: alpha-L-rhamnosidase C-terminal domain-containing protein, partial [Thermoprotei archaeon]